MRRGHPPPPRCRSQAFSASQRFASTPGLRGLVSCRSRPWGSPFRALLLARVAPPLGAACSLAVLRRSTCGAMLEASSSGFRRTRQACAWLASASPRSSDVVSGGLTPVFPDALDPAHRDHHVSCAVVRFEAFHPARVRARSHRLPGDREPLLSWASAPPEPSSDLSLGPLLTRRTVSVRRGASVAQARGATSRRRVRPLRPRGRVDLVGAGCVRSYRTSTRAASRRQPCLPRPWQPGVMNTRRAVLGGVKVSISQPSPGDGSALLGFPASSATSRLRETTPTLAYGPCGLWPGG
jgi:hypothetical protein